MRKGFNGLFGLVRDRLQCEPLSGHVFFVLQWTAHRLKLVFWDGVGCGCARRDGEGEISLAGGNGDQNKVQLSHESWHCCWAGSICGRRKTAAVVPTGNR